uniref:Uncharacterized protein n=1 Tax=Ostreococcus mediterraneus TaxID=1486918 RepID=A0A7S0WJP5_9CHLO|mmetsp:Transcript_1167/g.2508  ORF Transcript_1167/g.2508 Transcript_1167/m.2508 type:complete len:739 (+) Transcript_1167:87-2303(+)
MTAHGKRSGRRGAALACAAMMAAVVLVVASVGGWRRAESITSSANGVNRIRLSDIPRLKRTCAVSTTILEVNAAVERMVEALDASLVVVGDRKTNHSEWMGFQRLHSNSVTYLSPDDQMELPFEVVKRIPWNHFGRKSIGFLYATAGGCEIVYDFDDDNHLKPEGFEALSSWERFDVRLSTNTHVFNPYPYFQPSNNELIWPRGFPLQFIRQKDTYDATMEPSSEPFKNLAVIQSLADHDPDVDAIYRLTHSLPVSFNRKKTIVIPERGVYTPWNAQAVLVSRPAFFGLLLPVTVTGRVSDIWRSYITERLLWDTDYKLAFASSFVTQYRNPHSYMVDFVDEDDLYNKVDDMLQALAGWSSAKHASLSSAYIDLVTKLVDECNLLGRDDLHLAKAWVTDLERVGYVWPSFRQTRMETRTLQKVPIVDERHLGTDGDASNALNASSAPTVVEGGGGTAARIKLGGFIVTRNDNYGGDLVGRSTLALRRMIEVFDEVVVVDMNTPLGTPPFLALLPADISGARNIKSVVVSPEMCARELGAACEDKMYELLARNIGLRESAADVVVSTNSEVIVPSRLTLDEIIKQASLFDDKNAVILERVNIPQVKAQSIALSKGTEGKEGVKMLRSVRVQDFRVGPAGLMEVSIIGDCGDFQMAHRDLWQKIGGFAKNQHGHNFGDSDVIARWLSSSATVHVANVKVYHTSHTSHKHDKPATWNPEPRFTVVQDAGGSKRIMSTWMVA